MKKIISMLLSLAFAVGVFAVSVSAEGLTINGITNSDSSSSVNSNESSYSSGTVLSENSSQSSNSADTYENSGSVSNAVNSDAISGNSSNETHSDESSYDNNTEDEPDKETESTIDSFEQNINHNSDFTKKANRIKTSQSVIQILLFIFFPFGIYNAVTTSRLSHTSMKKKELPERRQTANTITTPTAEKKTYVVPINGRMTVQKAEKLINEWLAENPYIYNCKLKLETENSLISPFIKYKFFITEAVIEYSVADSLQACQYGLAFIYKYRFFGPIGYNEKKHVAEWQANNTDCQIISSRGGHIQHLHNGGLAWAQYYNYIFFKKRFDK